MTGVVGIPCADQSRWTAFHDCVESLQRPEGWHVKYAMGCSIAENCNLLVRYALERELDAILFLNDDLLFGPDVLLKFLRHAEPIVSGLSLFRRPHQGQFYPIWSQNYDPQPNQPWAFMTDITPGENGLVKLATAATGGMLVRREVFDALDGPYWFRLGQITPDQWCDDVDFCVRARAAGFTIWGDPAIQFGHITHGALWPYRQPDGSWSTIFARGFEPIVAMPAPFGRRRLAPEGFVVKGDSFERTTLVTE